MEVASFAPTTLELLVLETLDSCVSSTSVQELADGAGEILKPNSTYKILSRLMRYGVVQRIEATKPVRYQISREGKKYLECRRSVVIGSIVEPTKRSGLYRIPWVVTLPKTLSGTERLCLELLERSEAPQSTRWVIEQSRHWLNAKSAGTTLRRMAHRGYLEVWRARWGARNVNLYAVSTEGHTRLASVVGPIK